MFLGYGIKYKIEADKYEKLDIEKNLNELLVIFSISEINLKREK